MSVTGKPFPIARISRPWANSCALLVDRNVTASCHVSPVPFVVRTTPEAERFLKAIRFVSAAMTSPEAATVSAEPFAEHRDLLFAVAYRMLGTVADAEDVVQDAWLRWSSADRGDVAEPRAYLVRIVTNLAVDRMRTARARRESYVGPWLPEPLLTSPDVA